MGYAKIAHRILTDPKTEDLPCNAGWMFVRLIAWASREESDGAVPLKVARKFGSTRAQLELKSRGLVTEVDGSLMVTNFLKYQTSSAKIAEKRGKETTKKRKQRAASRGDLSTENREQRTENKEQSTEAKRASRRKPSTAIPEQWQPAPRHVSKSEHRSLDLTSEAERFRNHALANDRRCVDWDRAFDNWLLNARPAPRAVPGRTVSAQDQALENFMKGTG